MITTMLCEDFKRARTFEVCFCFEKEIFDLISEGKKHKASVFFLFFRIIIITQIIDTSKSNSPWRPTQKAKATTKNTTKDPTFLKPRLTKKSRKTTGARAFLFPFFPAVKCKRAIPYFLHSFSNSLLLFHRVGSITCAKIWTMAPETPFIAIWRIKPCVTACPCAKKGAWIRIGCGPRNKNQNEKKTFRWNEDGFNMLKPLT